MGNINYDKARYSLAIIDLDLFIEGLENLEESIAEAKDNMNLILTRNDEELVYFLQEYSLSKFENARKYIKTIKSKIDKYRNNLITYFSKNLVAKDTFNLKVKTLNQLIEEKSQLIDDYIEKCNHYILTNSKNKNSEK